MSEISTVTTNDLPHMIGAGLVKDNQYLKAMSFLRDQSFWKLWAVRALFALAVGHILSGIIFFFAFNWNDLSAMTKFGLVGSGFFASLAGWIMTKFDSSVGQALGITATVLVGVMFAVLGQVYQTPAMIHTPFVLWAVLTLPFALASKSLAHWTVWTVVLTVAISTYANSGLRLAGNNVGANILNIVVSGGFIGALILWDKLLSPTMAWARAEWFRVLLVCGAVGFAFLGFTESLWRGGSRGLFWIIALGLTGGLLAYLYRQKPTLATLSLATFGGFTLVAQFGLKFFDNLFGGVSTNFFIFIWLGALTLGLVSLFRHYTHILNTKTKASELEIEVDGAQVVPAEAFSNYLGVDNDKVTHFLSVTEHHQPWYIHVFLAIAGVLTAILGSLFFGSFVWLLVNAKEEFVFGILGIVIFLGAIFLRRKIKFQYLQHLLNTMIIIGGILAGVGIGAEMHNFDAIIFLLLSLSTVVLIFIRDRILEFLSAGAIIILIAIELYHIKAPMIETILLVISTIIGLVFLTQPIRNRLFNAAGTAFLMGPAALGIALVHSHRWARLADSSRFSDEWPARLIALLVLLCGVIYLNRGKLIKDFHPPIIVLVPLIIAAALVPLGGASALLLMLAGYSLGSKSLAIIGTFLQIYFLTMFYYDLSLDLLTKSIILFATGLIFLGVWIFINRKDEIAV